MSALNFTAIHPIVLEIFQLKTTKGQPHDGIRQKVSGSSKLSHFILWAPRMSAPHLIKIHAIFVGIFRSRPKSRTDWHRHPWSRAASIGHKHETCAIVLPEIKCAH